MIFFHTGSILGKGVGFGRELPKGTQCGGGGLLKGHSGCFWVWRVLKQQLKFVKIGYKREII